MEFPKLKVIRAEGAYSLVSSFNGTYHTWYIDNKYEVTEDIGIIEADTLLRSSAKDFKRIVKTYFG